MQEEFRDILEVAAGEPLPQEARPPVDLITVDTSTTGTWRREDIYGDAGR